MGARNGRFKQCLANLMIANGTHVPPVSLEAQPQRPRGGVPYLPQLHQQVRGISRGAYYWLPSLCENRTDRHVACHSWLHMPTGKEGLATPTRWNTSETVLSRPADTGDGVNRAAALSCSHGPSSLPPLRTRGPWDQCLSFDAAKGPLQAPLPRGRGGGGRV